MSAVRDPHCTQPGNRRAKLSVDGMRIYERDPSWGVFISEIMAEALVTVIDRCLGDIDKSSPTSPQMPYQASHKRLTLVMGNLHKLRRHSLSPGSLIGRMSSPVPSPPFAIRIV